MFKTRFVADLEDRSTAMWAICAGMYAAVIATAPSLKIQAAVIAVPLAAAFVYWLLVSPIHWLLAFFFAALLLPPLPLPGGNSGPSVAPFIASAGILSSLIWIRAWRSAAHPLMFLFTVFTGALFASLAFALLYSGWQIAAASLMRVVLFCIGVFVFVFAFAGPGSSKWSIDRCVRYLFALAVLGAAFACADFYYQFPAPGGFSDQFIWLQESVLRRAQGLFYDASMLGNFCAFFLIMVAGAYSKQPADRPLPRWALLFGGLFLAAALVLSFSRASIVNVAVGLLVLAVLRVRQQRTHLTTLASVLILATAVIYFVNPELAGNYWRRLFASFSYLAIDPNRALSGRINNWSLLIEFIGTHPWQTILGVGYKTLPYSTVAGQPIAADNTYLALLVETGVAGLLSFLALNVAILATGWKALRSQNPRTAFLGEWIFCFWCGQAVQMLSGDLITYWRVLPVYFWVLGTAARAMKDSVEPV